MTTPAHPITQARRDYNAGHRANMGRTHDLMVEMQNAADAIPDEPTRVEIHERLAMTPDEYRAAEGLDDGDGGVVA